jgi:hypothetical protein
MFLVWEIQTIDKFPFATDTNATDVGDLTQAIFRAAGQSSTTSGYARRVRNPTPPGKTQFKNFHLHLIPMLLMLVI